MTKNVLFDTALDMQMPEVSIQKHPPPPIRLRSILPEYDYD